MEITRPIARVCSWLVGLAALFSLDAAAQQKQIVVGLTTRTGSNSLPYVIAEEKGFFKAEGLNAVVVIMQNQVVVNGVVTKNVDYGGTFSNFVGAALAGLPVRIVMAAMDGSDHVLVTAPNVKKVQDLKGKTIGISSFGGTPHSEAVMILRKYGMNPEKDVTFLQIGGSSSRYAALESGSVQGVMLVPPFNKMARKNGFNELVSFNDVTTIPFGGLAVHVDKMKENPDEIVRMIKAILKSVQFIRGQRAQILSYMEKSWGIKDAEVREGIYQDLVPLYSRTGIAPDKTMGNVIRLVQEARKTKGEVQLSDIVDWRYAKKAGEEMK
jgi:NitT/TauT family transport system substrate-binding protein